MNQQPLIDRSAVIATFNAYKEKAGFGNFKNNLLRIRELEVGCSYAFRVLVDLTKNGPYGILLTAQHAFLGPKDGQKTVVCKKFHGLPCVVDDYVEENPEVYQDLIAKAGQEIQAAKSLVNTLRPDPTIVVPIYFYGKFDNGNIVTANYRSTNKKKGGQVIPPGIYLLDSTLQSFNNFFIEIYNDEATFQQLSNPFAGNKIIFSFDSVGKIVNMRPDLKQEPILPDLNATQLLLPKIPKIKLYSIEKADDKMIDMLLERQLYEVLGKEYFDNAE